MSSDLDTAMKHIWGVFDEMRDFFPLREAQFYLLGILGLKRLSEMNDGSVVQWHNIMTESYEVGDKLNRALVRVEEAHPEYQGWFSGLDFSLPSIADRARTDGLWQSVIKTISQISINDLVELDPPALSRLCMRINDQVSFAERRHEDLDPSENLMNLISGLLQSVEVQTVYDPLCKSGMTLISGITDARTDSLTTQMTFYAQTSSEKSALLIRLNLFCVGVRDAHIAIGDVILKPGFVEKRHLHTFDRIVCLIPTGVRNWGEVNAQRDPYGRFIYGIPPRSQGDFAYLQHCIASLSDEGVLVAAVAPSVLFKERSEGDIRRRIIEDDMIDAVVGLPPKLIGQTGMPLCLLVIRRNKPEERQGKILFVDASKDFLHGRGLNLLRDKDIDAIKKAYITFEEIEAFSTVCSVETIAEHGFTLEVTDYVIQPLELDLSLDLDEAIMELKNLQEERRRQYERMNETLTNLMEHGGMN